MEPLIVDVENELNFISREVDILKRKRHRIEEEKDLENIDSHLKAIALTMHSIYSGYEKIIEMLVKGLDGDVPTAVEYHYQPCVREQPMKFLMSDPRLFRKKPFCF